MNTPPHVQAATAGKPHLCADGAVGNRPATAEAGGESTQQGKASGESPRGDATGAARRYALPAAMPAAGLAAHRRCGEVRAGNPAEPLRLPGVRESPAPP